MLSIKDMRDELESQIDIDFAAFPDEHVVLIYDVYRVFGARQSAGLNAYLTALSSLMLQGNKEIEREALQRALQMRQTKVEHQVQLEKARQLADTGTD